MALNTGKFTGFFLLLTSGFVLSRAQNNNANNTRGNYFPGMHAII